MVMSHFNILTIWIIYFPLLSINWSDSWKHKTKTIFNRASSLESMFWLLKIDVVSSTFSCLKLKMFRFGTSHIFAFYYTYKQKRINKKTTLFHHTRIAEAVSNYVESKCKMMAIYSINWGSAIWKWWDIIPCFLSQVDRMYSFETFKVWLFYGCLIKSNLAHHFRLSWYHSNHVALHAGELSFFSQILFHNVEWYWKQCFLICN